MKVKRKIKKSVRVIFIISFALILVVLGTIFSTSSIPVSSNDKNYTYVNDYIFDNYTPVISKNEEVIIKPYSSENVSLYRNFYDKDAKEEEQEKSIVLSDGTYIQNSGVDYASENVFDVLSVYDGVVTNITDDPILGKTIEIKSDNNFVVNYQSLDNIKVKKGSQVTKGDIIASSGKCNINNEVSNSLHIEMYLNGKVLNPEIIYNKTLNDIQE